MSAFYNKPWASGYALPAYLKKEDPLTRGSAVVTAWLPRGTISKVPPGSKLGGYAVPNYVRQEPVGSQAYTTPWIPRGTVMSMKGIKTGLPWKSSAHTLDSNGLGALGASPVSSSSVGSRDPIDEYGNKAAATVLTAVASMPSTQREETLKEILDGVDPKLYPAYKKKFAKAVKEGLNAKASARGALASTFKRGFVAELIRIGEKGSVKRAGVKKGAVPLGALTGFDAQVSNYQGLHGAVSTVKDTLSKLGGLACDVATNPITPLAAGAAGAAYAGPVGASTAITGTGLAAAACSSGSGGGAFVPQPSAMPSWAMPAILGGGALALLLVLK
jgi:hypothetical protein